MKLRDALVALASGAYDPTSDATLRNELGPLLKKLPHVREMPDVEQAFIDFLLHRRTELEKLLAASEKDLPAFTCEVLKRFTFEEDRRTTPDGQLRKALDKALRGEGERKGGGALSPTWPAKILREKGTFDHAALRQAARAARAEGCPADHGELARHILAHFGMAVAAPSAASSSLADIGESRAQDPSPADQHRHRHDSARLAEEALTILSPAEKRALLASIRDPARRGQPSRTLTAAYEKLRRWCEQHSEITFSLSALMAIEIERQLEELIDRLKADLA